MSEKSKEVFFVVFVSAMIGLIIGMLEITMSNINYENINILIRDGVIGVIIGTISRFWFIYLYAEKRMNVKIVFFIIFITIGVISISPAIYFTIKYGKAFFHIELGAIFICAEFLGLSFSYFLYKYTLKLNDKLEDKKKQFLEVQEK